MDGRTSLFLALGLFAGALGCTHLDKNQPEVSEHITLMSEEDNAGKGTSDQPKKPPTPAMCVAAGDFFMQEASSKAETPNLQEQLYDKARKEYQQALRVNPKFAPGFQGLANWYLLHDDFEHAVATYQKALQVSPNSPKLWYDLGMCYCRKKDWNNGLGSLARAVELDPENRQYANMLGYTYARMGRYDESLACFAKVQTKGKAHYNLARMLLQTEQTDLARQHLQIAVQADPQLEVARNLLAQVNGVEPAPTAKNQQVQQASYQETMITARLPTQPPLPQPQPQPRQPVALEPMEPGIAPDLLPPPPPLQIDPRGNSGSRR